MTNTSDNRKILGTISSILYFTGGAICIFGDAMGGTRYLQAGIGLYMIGRGLQELREVSNLVINVSNRRKPSHISETYELAGQTFCKHCRLAITEGEEHICGH